MDGQKINFSVAVKTSFTFVIWIEGRLILLEIIVILMHELASPYPLKRAHTYLLLLYYHRYSMLNEHYMHYENHPI